MKKLFLWLFCSVALAAQSSQQIEPMVYFAHGWEGGEPLNIYYEIPPSLEVRSVAVNGLPITGWGILSAFGKKNIELRVNLKPNLDANWQRISINGKSVNVAPSRVMYVKPELRYPLSFEKLEQLPNDRLFLAMRIFNDSPETITIEKILYAPDGVSSDKVLIEPKYDSAFFVNIEKWVSNPGNPYPTGTNLRDSQKLNLEILPSRGFGAAIVDKSILYSCATRKRTRDPVKRYDTFFSQPIVVYRIGKGKSQMYPIPDQIVTDICP